MSGRVSVKSGARSLSYKKSLARGRSLPWGRRGTLQAAATIPVGSIMGSMGPRLRIARGLQPEVKFVSTSGSAKFNSTISSAGECYALMPQVTQGLDDY